MSGGQFRDVAPILQKVRNFLLGRDHITALRFAPQLATRSPPPPELPDGPCHRLNNNYYYARDARREVEPPEIVASAQLQIEAGKEATTSSVLNRRPGKIWQWD